MRVVSNLTADDHGAYIRQLMQNVDELFVVAPFIDDSLRRLVLDDAIGNLRRVIVVTQIADEPRAALLKCERLGALADLLAGSGRTFTLQLDQALHGKMYLFRRGGEFVAGLLGSANCTWNGFHELHEWSVHIEDRAVMRLLWQQVQSVLSPSSIVSRAELGQIAARAKTALAEAPPPIQVRRAKFVVRTGSGKRRATRRASRQVWLKPMGTAKLWIEVTNDYWNDPHELHFGRRPISVREHDLLITYAVGWQCITGVFEVVSGYKKVGAEKLTEWPDWKRWPWFFPAKPLTPEFTRHWHSIQLRWPDAVAGFASTGTAPQELAIIERAFRSLQHGNDKVRLPPAFSGFLLNAISEIDQR